MKNNKNTNHTNKSHTPHYTINIKQYKIIKATQQHKPYKHNTYTQYSIFTKQHNTMQKHTYYTIKPHKLNIQSG